MISELSIRNFKQFKSLRLRLRPLSVLTGVNGAGKSTVIQALLLARQAARTARTDDGSAVRLNGPYGLALGEAQDVLHHDAEEQEVSIQVRVDAGYHDYFFEAPDERALHLPVRDSSGADVESLSRAGRAFTYLTAERLGPRDQLSVDSQEQARVGVGHQGEYTAQVLAMHTTDEVREPLRHPGTEEDGVTTLRTQVEAWATDIVRPVRINAQWSEGVTASTIRFQNPGLVSEPIRPSNMGFGVSYALPIIVAGLLAPPDGLLIVENPEAHLHPAGQSLLGRFLGRIAGSGVQVMVETHSDHVLNGVRLAATEDGTLAPGDAVVHFFGDDAENGPEALDLTSRGGLTHWPRGFFDQIEHDLGRLARAKRRTR